MVSFTYDTGQVEALFVHRASGREIGQLWIPKLGKAMTCSAGMEQYELGQWLRFDLASKRVVEKLHSGPYESQLDQMHSIVKVKVPIVYFSDQTSHKLVAYSPQFGRVGTFCDPQNLFMDKLHYAWIAYMALLRDDNQWRKLLREFDVDWVLCNPTLSPVLITEQIREENQKSGNKFENGIVVHSEEEQIGNPAQIYTALHIWTPQLDGAGKSGIAIHRISGPKGGGDANQKKLQKIGTACKLMIFKNWSNEYSAISPLPVEMPDGIFIMQAEPELKLKVAHSKYQLDQDPAVNRIHVPRLIGPVNCSRDFMKEFRRAQNRRSFLPRLFIDFQRDEWRAVDFDGRSNSPPPPERESTSSSPSPVSLPQEDFPHFPEGFGQGSAFTKYRSSKSISTVSTKIPDSSNSTNTLNVVSRKSKTAKDSTDGWSHSNVVAGFVHRSRSHSPVKAAQQVPQQLLENVELRDSPPPSICSDFDDFEESDEEKAPMKVELDRTTATESTFTNRRQSNHPFRGNAQRRGADSRRRGTNSSRFALSSSFLDRCSRPTGKEKKNLSGVVVSTDGDKGFYVYSPEYGNNELFLPKSKVKPGCRHCAWIIFDVIEENGKVEIVDYKLDDPAPYVTTKVRNTVQISLNGMVPKRWCPKMSTFVPVINTDFVESVIDSKGLLCDEFFAGASLPIVIERQKDEKWSGYMWFVAKLLGEFGEAGI